MIFQRVMIQSGAIKASQSPQCLFLIVHQWCYLHIKHCGVNVLLSVKRRGFRCVSSAAAAAEAAPVCFEFSPIQIFKCRSSWKSKYNCQFSTWTLLPWCFLFFFFPSHWSILIAVRLFHLWLHVSWLTLFPLFIYIILYCNWNCCLCPLMLICFSGSLAGFAWVLLICH